MHKFNGPISKVLGKVKKRLNLYIMEKVLVTGANGLLGTNLVVNLLEHNYYVKALVRDISKFIPFTHPNLELVTGNICDIAAIELHSKDCAYVIHSAANTSQNLLKVSDYDKVNFIGTKNIIGICKKFKIQRLIYIGTSNTFGYGSLNNPGDENKPPKPPFTQSPYVLSKLKAQELIDKSCDELDTVTIAPTFMIGAYDTKPSSGKIILMAVGKKILFYPPGGKNFIHVKDVALATIKALKDGVRGEKYILANANLSYKEFFKTIAGMTNEHPVMVRLPSLVLYIVGWVGNMVRFLGVKTDISSVNMKILTIKNFYSNQKAKKTLGIEFSSIDTAIVDAVKWFQDNKVI
jgi:dihydroflavonol-4-reductase